MRQFQQSKSQVQHLDALDGLRGIAALIVVISHSANAELIPRAFGMGFGQMGVGVFFALSGFLIGHLYLIRPVTPDQLRGYALRRVARVLPLFYAVLLGATLFNLGWGHELYEIDTTAVFLGNALLTQGSSVLWSIPVEIQFYVIFVLIWVAHGRLGLNILLIAGGLVGLQAIGVVALRLAGGEAGYLNIVHWLHFFVFGLVLARLRAAGTLDALRWLAPWVAVAFVLLLPVALPEVRRQMGLPVIPSFADPISAGLPVALLLLVLWRVHGTGVLALKPMRRLGDWSFGIYLLHIPVLHFVLGLGWPILQGTLGFALVMVLSILAGAASRWLIELPAQSWLMARFGAGRSRKGVAAPSS